MEKLFPLARTNLCLGECKDADRVTVSGDEFNLVGGCVGIRVNDGTDIATPQAKLFYVAQKDNKLQFPDHMCPLIITRQPGMQ